MKRQICTVKKSSRRFIIVDVLLLAAYVITSLISGFLEALPQEQLLEKRWSESGAYGQSSVFLSENTALSLEDIYELRTKINDELSSSKVEEKEFESWIDAYSMEDYLIVSKEDKAVDTLVTAVGGKFFLFRPIPLITGSYFWEDDSNTDLVIIDEILSFQLFGSTDVVGMNIDINGKSFIISGVSRCEDHFAYEAAYGEFPRMYMNYLAYKKMELGESIDQSKSIDNSKGLTVYQVLLPDLVEHYAYDTLIRFMGETEKDYGVVEYSERYVSKNLFHVLGEFGKRSMKLQGISYPYWENAARMIEDYDVLLLLLRILFLFFLVCCTLKWFVLRWSGNVCRIRDICDCFMNNARKLKSILKIVTH